VTDFDKVVRLGVPVETCKDRATAAFDKFAAAVEKLAPGKPNIRAMRESDIPELLEIENASFPDEPYTEDTFDGWVGSGGGVVAQVGDKLVAYLLHRSENGFEYAHSIAVHPDHRRKGLGQALIRHLMDAYDHVSADVDTDNGPSNGMFKKLGFKTVRTYSHPGRTITGKTINQHRMHYSRPEKSAALTVAKLTAAAKETNPDPTDAQKEHGRYKKGRVSWKGLVLAIETAKGEIRSGKAPDGTAWQTTMRDHYGYISGTESDADGDAIDFFLNDDNLDSELVFIVNQKKKKDGTFDEGKVILGCIAEDAAVKCYLRNYSKGWNGFGSIVALTLPQFKRWLTHGNTARPLRDGDVSVKAGAARSSATAGVPDLVTDEGSVSQQEEQEVRVLRGEGNRGLSKMAGQLLGVLLGHGAKAGQYSAGPSRQRQELHADELPVGNTHGTVEKQAERAEVHVQWPNLDFATVGGSSWYAVSPSTDTTAAIRLDAGAGVHDAVKFAEAHVTFDHAQRPYADSTGVGQGDGHLAGDDRLSAQPGVVGGTGFNVTIDRPKGFKKKANSAFEYDPVMWFVKRAADEHGHPFTIAVDLDGTLAKQEKPFNVESVGEPITKAVKWVRRFHAAGARIIIFTVRGSIDLVRDWLEEHEVPFDYINENPDQPPNSSGKVFADVYWDDRAYNAVDPDEHGPEILRRAKEHSKEEPVPVSGSTLITSMEESNGGRNPGVGNEADTPEPAGAGSDD